MKKIERVKKNIENDKEIMKQLDKELYYNINDFISDVNVYIKAVKEGRILYHVGTVSKSGMSRTILIQSCERRSYNGKTSYGYRQYIMMLKVTGYTVIRGWHDTIRVYGCGMNMLFATNYNLIHKFYKLGFINKSQCEKLCQAVN